MDYARSVPQETVEAHIEYMSNRNEGESFYVVCCMACGEELQKALRTVHIDREQNFSIILGVDRIIFPGEEHDIILIEWVSEWEIDPMHIWAGFSELYI